MSNKTTPVSDLLHDYLLDISLREPDVLKRLREATARLPERNMQIAPEQGQFMQLLLNLMSARRCIEVGTFTGYSTLAMAQALPEDGRLLACDVSREWTDMGRPYWEEAGVASRIDLRIAPAEDTLKAELEEAGGNVWDFAFIDADKPAYPRYFDLCLALLRPGGLIAVDNTLWDGKVADPAVNDEDTRAIRAFNEDLLSDERVEISLVPIGDGLTLARKR
ncbi:putative O-methyltransferase YrrM [Natronospira proteinivora]|uniref:O-methyltransferase YrrM n=1 Tax=Natronospira proteinivora TaxID=1807133 RepID=A0ABT1G446_9GAMM|nr:class I SAM-dependent methyltransferase [Natronospira proteinivora]MCP1726050.1 putative O-methyltransferase YrrM [Natronospira proteinivora]